MNQKQLSQRINVIRQYCAETAHYVDQNYASLERIVEFLVILKYFYHEIEDLLGEFLTFQDKQVGYQTQRAINSLIYACENCLNNTGAFD